MNYAELAKQKMKDKQVRELTANYIEWKENGQVIIGRYESRNAVKSQSKDGFYYQYLFDTDEGNVKFALGSATDNAAASLMTIGGIYQVTFEGKVRLSAGRRMNKFTILELEAGDESAVGGGSDIPF